MKITILGAGNGAHALAGDLSLRGHEVTLWENPAFEQGLEYLRANDNRFRLTGVIENTARIAHVTTDAATAMKEAEIVYCVMPSYAQENAFDHIAPFAREGQSFLIMPGNFGSISLYMRLKKRGVADDVLIGESDTIPYATRLQPDKSCLVFGLKPNMWISAIPAKKTEELIASLEPAFPIGLMPLPDVLSVALANTNMILHCPTMIMNAGRIEFCDRFRFYNDGMTPSVCRVMEAMDRERLAVGGAWGCKLISEFDDAIANYALDGSKYKNLHEIFSNHPVYGNHGPDSPTAMSYRYLSEDVPFLLVPVSEMGRAAGIPTPTIDSIVQLAEVANDAPYRRTGRGLAAMGMADMAVGEARKIITG